MSHFNVQLSGDIILLVVFSLLLPWTVATKHSYSLSRPLFLQLSSSHVVSKCSKDSLIHVIILIFSPVKSPFHSVLLQWLPLHALDN